MLTQEAGLPMSSPRPWRGGGDLRRGLSRVLEARPSRTQASSPEMVEKLAGDGLVRLGIMTLAGRPVAAQIWLVCRRKATIFKLAHRQDAADHSPGTLLTDRMVETLVREECLEEIDFGRGGDAYKRDWLDRERSRMGVIMANWRSRQGLWTITSEVLPTRLSAVLRHGLDRVALPWRE